MNDPSGNAPSRGETEPSAVLADGASKLPQPRVTLWEIFATFLVIGATSFGGGVIAYLRNSLVGVKGWLDEDEFLTALEISQALPGLNATNMSVVVGDRLRGAPGAAAAFLGMVLPGAIMVFVLGVLYATHRHNPAVEGILKGIGAASVGLLAAVTLQIGRRQLARAIDLAIIAVTVLLVSYFGISLVIVLLTVAPAAVFIYRPHPARPLAPDRSGLDTKRAD